jgi:hypothetical protein
MFHQPDAAGKKADKVEIQHFETVAAGQPQQVIQLNKKLALRCSKEDVKPILCNKGDADPHAAARARSNSASRRLNSFFQVFKPPQPVPATHAPRDDSEDFIRTSDPSMKVNFAPLPSVRGV